MSKIIHIPSSKMTSLPSYNPIVDNKIDAVGYKYSNISLSSNPPYSFTITKNSGETIDQVVINENKINADIVKTTKLYSASLKKDISVLILRKKLTLNNQIISLDYYIGADGSSKNIGAWAGKDGDFTFGNEITTYTNYIFENSENFNINNFLPETDVEYPCIYIDMSTLKYNFVDFVFYLPFEIFFNIAQLSDGFTVKLFTQTDKPNDININLSGVIYDVEKVDVDNDGYSLLENEFYQNKTVINGVPIYDYISSEILTKWGSGRQTMSLTCVYGTYYEYGTNNVVLNGLDGKMIDVGDIVIPTRLYTDANTNENSEVPIALTSDNSEKQFEVLSSEIEFNNGKLVAHLKLMEVK